MITIIYSILALIFITTLSSILLLFLNNKYNSSSSANKIIDSINNLLPQTQCGQCSFPGCKPYATAISNNEADINRCPPGGQETIDKLAKLLNTESKPLLEELEDKSQKQYKALIKEEECIGCLLCIKACPVDAIVGANKKLHTVITNLCTGCELCIAPCPMDCIDMVEEKTSIQYQEHLFPLEKIKII